MAAMKGGAVLVLVGITAVAAYGVGRQDTPSSAPRAVAVAPSVVAKPLAFASPTVTPPPAIPTPTIATAQPPAPLPGAADKPAQVDTKTKVEVALTAAAIVAILIQASRHQYHATGHPCACPDDRARNGSLCGGRSARSRPGGASPLCYPSDVTAAMIESYRNRIAQR
jgi:hypothetical protein